MSEEAFLASLLTPISLVEEGLFIGNREGALNKDMLTSLNIKHVLQIQNFETQPFFPGHFTYLCLHIADFPTSDITALLPQALLFIAQARQLGENVFVHCDGGVSRSGSVIVAYLMATRDLGFDEALSAAKAARLCIGPNEGFEVQLRGLHLEMLKSYLRG
jgi:protein-tyrosine phosphatase